MKTRKSHDGEREMIDSHMEDIGTHPIVCKLHNVHKKSKTKTKSKMYSALQDANKTNKRSRRSFTRGPPPR